MKFPSTSISVSPIQPSKGRLSINVCLRNDNEHGLIIIFSYKFCTLCYRCHVFFPSIVAESFLNELRVTLIAIFTPFPCHQFSHYTGWLEKKNGNSRYSRFFQDFALIYSHLCSPCWIEHLFLIIITYNNLPCTL